MLSEFGCTFLGVQIALVAIPETTALVIGRMFGKHNFSYFISPKKTWEGLVGQFLGIIPSLMMTEFICYLTGMNRFGLTPGRVFIAGIFVIVVEVLGDLMESILKRAVNVKDSSTIQIVGKLGGILDKFDSFGVAWIMFAVWIRIFNPEYSSF